MQENNDLREENIPHTRGDEPTVISRALFKRSYSPHTRG